MPIQPGSHSSSGCSINSARFRAFRTPLCPAGCHSQKAVQRAAAFSRRASRRLPAAVPPTGLRTLKNTAISYVVGTGAVPERPAAHIASDRNLLGKNGEGCGPAAIFGVITRLRVTDDPRWDNTMHVNAGNIHNLALSAAKDSERAKQWSKKPSLPAGRYLVKVYVDANERLKPEWQSALGESEFVGETILETKWPSGYGRMTSAAQHGVNGVTIRTAAARWMALRATRARFVL